MRLITLAIAMQLVTSVAFACSCGGNASYCSALSFDGVVFVGRVIVDTGEGHGTRPATVAVEEVLRGLPKDPREVTVDSMAGTSSSWDMS